jgi:hypothetical protein
MRNATDYLICLKGGPPTPHFVGLTWVNTESAEPHRKTSGRFKACRKIMVFPGVPFVMRKFLSCRLIHSSDGSIAEVRPRAGA